LAAKTTLTAHVLIARPLFNRKQLESCGQPLLVRGQLVYSLLVAPVDTFAARNTLCHGTVAARQIERPSSKLAFRRFS
jgi:hypothetical protein